MSVTQTFRGKVDLSGSGALLELSYIGSTTPGSEVDAINYTVPVGYKVVALQVYSSCRIESKLRFLVDSTQIGSWRHGAGVLNSNFTFSPFREINENEIIKIKLLAENYRPVSDIEIYLQARLTTI